jgi:hypothetical protein
MPSREFWKRKEERRNEISNGNGVRGAAISEVVFGPGSPSTWQSPIADPPPEPHLTALNLLHLHWTFTRSLDPNHWSLTSISTSYDWEPKFIPSLKRNRPFEIFEFFLLKLNTIFYLYWPARAARGLVPLKNWFLLIFERD